MASYVDSELTYEWQRKAAMEGRAFSIVTANLAIAALFFAIADQIDILPKLDVAPSSWLKVVALTTAAISVVFGVAAAFPISYSAPKMDAMKGFIDEAPTIADDAAVREILEARYNQLKTARFSNDVRAIITIIAFTAMAVSAGTLLAALFFASN